MRQVFSAYFIPRNNVRVSLSSFYGNNVNSGGDDEDDDHHYDSDNDQGSFLFILKKPECVAETNVNGFYFTCS